MTRVLEKATPALAKPLQPSSEKEAGRLKQRLLQAGFRREDAATVFLGMKFLCLCIGFCLGGGGLLLFGTGYQSLLRCAGAACLMFFIPDILLYLIGSQRKTNIFLGLPDALDLMVVCVESGLGLDQAMRKVSEEMKKTYRVIAEEFGLCNLQMQMGKSRAEALQDLGTRSGVDDLRCLASILIQADKFGSSIAQALRVQSDSMRTRRRQIAEEKAAKTAVKLIFPLVMFIFPGIFVVLVGPAAIEMYRKMFTAMNGG
jgi:tight adherence protein C